MQCRLRLRQRATSAVILKRGPHKSALRQHNYVHANDGTEAAVKLGVRTEVSRNGATADVQKIALSFGVFRCAFVCKAKNYKSCKMSQNLRYQQNLANREAA